MDIQEFVVNRDQHMRPLEYDLSENFNELLRYMQDMGILDNVPVGVTSESEIVSISDAYPAPPRALNVYGKSTQAGTPTPDAPVPILSVDDLSLVLAGKNMLDSSSDAFSGTIHGLTYAWDGLRLTVSGTTNAANTDIPRINFYNPVLLGGGNSHTFSMPGTFVVPGTTLYYRYYTDSDPTIKSSYISGGANVNSWTMTHSGNLYIVGITLRIAGNAATVNINAAIQIELGSTATAYEPYQSVTVPDLLPEGTELRYLDSTVRDRLDLSYLRPSERDGYAWYSRKLVTRVGERQFQDGNFTWYASSGGAMGFRRSLTGSLYTGSRTVCRSNRLPYANEAANYGCYIRHSEFGFNPQDLADIAPSGLTAAGLTEFNEWNLTHPINVIYRLASPVTTQLDPIELPTLPAPNATVWCDGGNAQPTLMLEYVKDASAAIADLSEAIADIVSG